MGPHCSGTTKYVYVLAKHKVTVGLVALCLAFLQAIPLDSTGYGQILGQAMFTSRRMFACFATMADENDW